MFGKLEKPKEAVRLDSERVEEFVKVLRKKRSELTMAEEITIHTFRESNYPEPEFYEAVGIVMKEIGIIE